jgi:hypothetical protein
MKSKALMFGLCAASVITPAFAGPVIEITGATAFREAAILSIRSLYSAGYTYGHNKTAGSVTSSDSAIFIGTIPGISGTTIIRTTFSGSVEGVRSVTSSNSADQEKYISATGITLDGLEHPSLTATETAFSDYSFSDVAVASTPYAASPILPSANSPAGVVVFTMVTNDGSPVTNVTSQNFRALFARGYQSASLFTGVPTDTSLVLAVGRNDGSGTRTTYLAETGYGITNPVSQYVGTASSGDNNTQFQLTVAGSAYASTVWDQDFDGNGGYSSGGDIRSILVRKGANATVLDEFGDPIFANQTVNFVSFLSLSDALKARTVSSVDTGAKIIAYNGVKLNDVAVHPATAMSAADLGKITHGAYTAWGYEQLYRRASLTSGPEVTIFNSLMTAIGSNLGSAGIAIPSMAVSRSTDGGVVGP